LANSRVVLIVLVAGPQVFLGKFQHVLLILHPFNLLRASDDR
jgi:hypothetical protein